MTGKQFTKADGQLKLQVRTDRLDSVELELTPVQAADLISQLARQLAFLKPTERTINWTVYGELSPVYLPVKDSA